MGKIILDDNFSPILLTLGQYEFFISHGKQGIDALILYIHLIYTARRQHENQSWTAGDYLNLMSNDRIKKAETFLREHGFMG